MMLRIPAPILRLGRRYPAWCLAVVLLAAVLCIVLWHRSAGKAAAETTEPAPAVVDSVLASVHSMDATVSAQGTLVPAQGESAKVTAMNAGRLMAVRVREGDHVTAGQVVAILDDRLQRAQVQSAVSALRASQIQAEQTRLSVQSTASEQSNAVQVAKLELQVAETELQKLRKGARPQELVQADQAVNQAQATYNRAATELNRVKFLNEKGIMAKRELDDAQTSLSVAESALQTAKAQASLLREGAHPDDVRAAELRVETARANLAQAKKGALQVAEKKQESLAASESVSQKNADLAAAQTAAGYSVLRSPVSGLVTRRNLNPGDMADPSTPVIEVANPHTLDISADVPADEGGAIRPGMPVRVRVNGLAHPITGSVLDVGQIDPQSGLLAVRISVPNDAGTLKIGAFATADIVVRTNPRATVVPKEAVITRDGRPQVFVVGADSVAHQREVSTGVEQDGLIEVVSGIAPGERVIKLGQYELTDGTKVRISSGGS